MIETLQMEMFFKYFKRHARSLSNYYLSIKQNLKLHFCQQNN